MLFWEESFTCQLLYKQGYSTSRISLTWAKIHTEHCVSIYLTYVTKGNKSKQEVEPGQFYQKNIPCVYLTLTVNKKCVVYLVGHGNRFVTTEPKFLYLKSPGVKFMNYFNDLKNPLLKSFGSYKVEWVKWWFFTIFTFKSKCHRVIIWQIAIKILYLVWNKI